MRLRPELAEPRLDGAALRISASCRLDSVCSAAFALASLPCRDDRARRCRAPRERRRPSAKIAKRLPRSSRTGWRSRAPAEDGRRASGAIGCSDRRARQPRNRFAPSDSRLRLLRRRHQMLDPPVAQELLRVDASTSRRASSSRIGAHLPSADRRLASVAARMPESDLLAPARTRDVRLRRSGGARRDRAMLSDACDHDVPLLPRGHGAEDRGARQARRLREIIVADSSTSRVAKSCGLVSGRPRMERIATYFRIHDRAPRLGARRRTLAHPFRTRHRKSAAGGVLPLAPAAML